MLIFKTETLVTARRKPINLRMSDESLFECEYLKEIGSSNVLINNNNAIFLSQCIAENVRSNRFAIIRYAFSQLYKQFGLRAVPKAVLSIIMTTILPRQCFKTGIWIADKWSHDYFHWVTESLTKIFVLSYFNINEIVLLPNQYKHYKYIKESLEYFKIPYAFLASNRETTIETMYNVQFDYDPGNFDYRLIKLIASKLKSINHNNILNKVWISRLHAKKRKILNEIELYPILSKHNVKIVYPETFSFSEQVLFFQQVHLIIGLHGAGLTNMIFMQSESQVIEIRKKEDYHSNCYFALASDLHHDYYYLLADPVNNEAHNGDCFVDPAKLDNLLWQITQNTQ